MLSPASIQQFIEKGFVKIEGAFSRELAAQGREILWQDTGCDPDNPATWTQPVIRLGGYAQPPFAQAVNTPQLHQAFDQLVGVGRWQPRNSLGTFPVRFPSAEKPGDDGWHVDAGFPGEDANDFFNWRVNIYSQGRALLMLFLFSDVGKQEAPTRIAVGSHLEVAKLLLPAGEAGMSFMELAGKISISQEWPVELATGEAGTVYLCHPFLVHAAQPHQGKQPRFMAQPPLLPAGPFMLNRADGAYSPVEQAIRLGINV
ncbi:phytanoyl-CoA dioxygenase family protein [Rhodocytophaga aerolata]|uniref:Phytanoyl-CoA dioxygenase family protein n=1 Tax=Rhodocytophaga aerolata TaxID=455078 RepID=A0ABT8R719_9BACT|nr:phytanoyl-CoA dioxygenase family protein [Rhodocytophaga aerolata]MDO1447903.1 phytanoyl-CoA dioxygenase family protein [Rhodocytophaga aerolata]